MGFTPSVWDEDVIVIQYYKYGRMKVDERLSKSEISKRNGRGVSLYLGLKSRVHYARDSGARYDHKFKGTKVTRYIVFIRPTSKLGLESRGQFMVVVMGIDDVGSPTESASLLLRLDFQSSWSVIPSLTRTSHFRHSGRPCHHDDQRQRIDCSLLELWGLALLPTGELGGSCLLINF